MMERRASWQFFFVKQFGYVGNRMPRDGNSAETSKLRKARTGMQEHSWECIRAPFASFNLLNLLYLCVLRPPCATAAFRGESQSRHGGRKIRLDTSERRR